MLTTGLLPGFLLLPVVLMHSLMQHDLFEKLEPLARLAVLVITHLENGRFENLIAKAEMALDLYIGQYSTPVIPPAPSKPFADSHGQTYSLAEVMPQKAACHDLGISEGKMKLMRKAGEFTVLRKQGDEQLVKPPVWLLRSEVAAQRIAYSVPKGKV